MSSQADDEVPLTQEEKQAAELAGLSAAELRSSFGASDESPEMRQRTDTPDPKLGIATPKFPGSF